MRSNKIFLPLLILSIIKKHFCMEYCFTETFAPKCSIQEVILIQKAVYGRMYIGKCLKDIAMDKTDYKYFGCQVDVLSLLDKHCSTRSECSLRIISSDLIEKATCHKDLNMFLEADYDCLKVVQQERSCSILINDEPIHLPSSFQPASGCGRKNQPWHLQTTSGQVISVELITLGVRAEQGVAPASVQCVEELGQVMDPKVPKNVPICVSQQRYSFVYKSASNELQIALNHILEKYKFLLKFYSTGCMDLKPASDAWMKREGDVTTIGCHTTRHLWMLHCVNDKWTGVIGNCTQQLIESKKLELSYVPIKEKIKTESTLNVVSISCMVLVAIILAICVITLCYCRLKKFGAKKMAPYAYAASMNGVYPPFNPNLNRETMKPLQGPPLNYDATMGAEEGRYFVLDRDVIDADPRA